MKTSISTADSLNPLFTIERIDLLVKAPDPPTNHCSPLLTEQGTTAFHVLFTKVNAVPGFPSIRIDLSPNTIEFAFADVNFLILPSINRLPIFEFGSAAIAVALVTMAGHAVAGYE